MVSGSMTDCIEGPGWFTETGYKKTRHNGKIWRSHRLAWTLVNGPIPEGMHICHSCDNRACSNVEHLFLGTHRDNMADMMKKGRQVKGEKNGQSKITTDQAIEIKSYLQQQCQHQDIATFMSVSLHIVRGISRGRNWRHV
jgi:hypothetical protein